MENNGRGIFYGVIGVATLVVAIIGATFAFFAASTQGNTFNTTSANVQNLQLEDWKDGLKGNLVPIDADGGYYNEYHTKFASAAGRSKCIDSVGNNICSIYKLTVTNPNDIPQKIYWYLNQSANDFSNLYYAVFEGEPETYPVYSAKETPGTEVAVTTANGTADLHELVVAPTKLLSTDVDKNVMITQLTQDLAAKGSVTYTFIVWLEEIGSQQDADLNKTFAASLNINTAVLDAEGNATGGVTGVLVG